MDTLVSPPVRIRTPRVLSWVIVGLWGLVTLLIWWLADLWRVFTQPGWQFDLDDSLPRHKLLILALFACGVVLGTIVTMAFAYAHHWMWFEWFAPLFTFAFLYSVATYNRFTV